MDKFIAGGPFVVLNDGSTYSGASGCAFVYLDNSAAIELEESNDFKHITLMESSVVIPVDDLVDAYNQVHGTDY